MVNGNQNTTAFSQMLVGRYLFYGHDALDHCQDHRVERTAVTECMDHITAGLAKVLVILLVVCSPLVLPAKFLLIEMTHALEKQRYDDPVGVALSFSPDAFAIVVMSFVIVLLGWLVVKVGKRLVKGDNRSWKRDRG